MMRDRDENEAVHQNLRRWRDMLKSEALEIDARRALRELINDAEQRLAEIEGRAGVHRRGLPRAKTRSRDSSHRCSEGETEARGEALG